MAIALDTSGAASATGSSTLSITNITLAGSNRCLFAYGHGTQNGPSSITYAGDALTTIASSDVNYVRTSARYKVAPSTSANQTLALTLAGSSDELYLGYANYTDVDQSTPIGTAQTDIQASVGNLTPAVTLTSATGELCVAWVGATDLGSSVTGSLDVSSPTGQTKIASTEILDINTYTSCAGISKAGAASVDMGVTLATSGAQYGRVLLAWPVKPTGGGGGGRIMSSLAHYGGLAGMGGLAGIGGGLAG